MKPPALPTLQSVRPTRLDLFTKVLVAIALVGVICFASIIGLRIFGMLRPFYMPTGGMAPAVSPGDHIMMEGLTFRSRQPRRGDIVCFKTDGIPSLPPAQIYVKRVAGEPGEHLRISGGMLYINGSHVSLSNEIGEISLLPPPLPAAGSMKTDVTIPAGWYFVLGDNSTNSYDSRFYGCVPRENILGRIPFCYWPPRRVGAVK
jgi:signal peptidase I